MRRARERGERGERRRSGQRLDLGRVGLGRNVLERRRLALHRLRLRRLGRRQALASSRRSRKSTTALDGWPLARPSKIMRGVLPLPYTAWLAASSIDSTAPSRAMPANRPRARDHDQISALSWPSVAAAAVRPTGPAATLASPPRVSLPLTIESRPRAPRNTSTMSEDCTPAWKPTLPPVSLMKLGLDQVPSGFFTDTRPWPRRPPNTRPTLSVSGTTTIARASSNSLSGIADSGICWMSPSTRTASRARWSSSGPATAAVADRPRLRARLRLRRRDCGRDMDGSGGVVRAIRGRRTPARAAGRTDRGGGDRFKLAVQASAKAMNRHRTDAVRAAARERARAAL